MKALKELDKVAYVRFASVYRSFEDIREFGEEIARLEIKLATFKHQALRATTGIQVNHDTVKNDYFWMAKAIQLAQQGRFTTSNPRVGCVIVDENNQLLGQGYHIQAGTPHAEVHALRHASNARPQGAAARRHTRYT